jgi:organic radical activating enzyme
LDWLKETETPTLAILGGEPTLHPDLLFFLEALWGIGVCPVLFTNALFPPVLAPRLAFLAHNIVVNYNDPASYSPKDLALREKNLGLLLESGAKVSFSKNFAPNQMAYGYLIEAALGYGVKTIRYDLSRPRADQGNNHFADLRGQERAKAEKAAQAAGRALGPEAAQAQDAAMTLVNFVREATAAGLTVGLDCCLPLCLFEPADLDLLKTHSQPFNGACRPSLDILPDLSAIHCWPLKGIRVPKVILFEGEMGLLHHFAEEAYELRQRARSLCPNCPEPPSACQGGCLAGAL